MGKRAKMLKHFKMFVLFAGALNFQVAHTKTLRVPSQFSTISAALAHADFGDSVNVSPGRYSENVVLVQGVVLKGTNVTNCIIDGMRRGPAVYGVAGSEISNFTITNGIDGILCENASLRIHHNWIVDNEGAGIGAFLSLPQIDNNVIYGNRWTGILVWGAKSLDTKIENNVILKNGYSGISLRGPARIVVRDNIISENLEYGIFSDPAAGQSQVTYNDIFRNVMAFNRYTKVNKSNISVDPMFLSPSLSQPNFFPASRSPVIRRGYEQKDIGLMDHEMPVETKDVSSAASIQETATPSPSPISPVAISAAKVIAAPADSFIVDGINFPSGTAELSLSSFEKLNEIAEQLKKYPESRFEVSGHTDNLSSDNVNMKLSLDRANAVRDYLVKKGVNSQRLVAKGYGSSQPKSDNKTAVGQALNRRIEFHRIK